MDNYSANWLDYCDKGQKAIETVIDYILMEYGKAKDVNQFDLEKRCGIKFEVYSSPVLNELLNTMTNAEVSVNNLKDFKAYLETNPNDINKLISAI